MEKMKNEMIEKNKKHGERRVKIGWICDVKKEKEKEKERGKGWPKII